MRTMLTAARRSIKRPAEDHPSDSSNKRQRPATRSVSRAVSTVSASTRQLVARPAESESDNASRPAGRAPVPSQQPRHDNAGLEEVVNLMAREVPDGTLEPTAETDRISRLVKECRLGGAYVTGFGVGHVDGIVDLDQNPNNRVNPRALVQSHVDDLKQVIMDPGVMRDWETPIVLMIRPEHIEPDCLSQIKACDPRSPGGKIPRLKLVSPYEANIEALEFACAYGKGKEDNLWLDEKQIASHRSNLEALWSSRPKATLVNGNHRIKAIKDIGAQSTRQFHDLARKLLAKDISLETAQHDIPSIAQTANASRYRVEIYNADLVDEELLMYLARNDDSRIARGMEPSEKTWWTATRFKTWLDKAKDSSLSPGADAYNAAHQDWLRSLGAIVDKERKRGGRRAEWAGPDAVDRLLTEPLTTLMVLDTYQAKPLYDSVIKPTLASSLVHEDSALVTCRVWLATRLLLNIFNVDLGSGFDEARAYLQASPPLDSPGDPAAVAHWQKLHDNPEQRPSLLAHYTPAMQKRFDSLYEQEMTAFRDTAGEIYPPGDVRLVLPLRRVFDALGTWLWSQTPANESQKIATSLRLYARLPAPDSTSPPADDSVGHSATFYASSALPAPRWINAALDKRPKESLDAASLILDLAMHHHRPVWTVGAQSQGTSFNSSRWFQRSRGHAHLALLIVQSDLPPCVEDALQIAVTTLAQPKLQAALQAIQDDCGRRVKQLLADCSVTRSSPAHIPVLAAIAAEQPDVFGPASELQSQLTKARQSLRVLVQNRPFPSPDDIARHMDQFGSLVDVFYPDFWRSFPVQEWLEGWNTADNRRFQDVKSLVGWSIFLGRLAPLVDEVLARCEEARRILCVRETLTLLYNDLADCMFILLVPGVDAEASRQVCQ
ncbi:hypothetical protein FS749_012197 [Ceratobasidium sp. UAMH 11750]|nr:hypothetical protein FS749_012197 [Ceratobasidium sp. UAMH 11750]